MNDLTFWIEKFQAYLREQKRSQVTIKGYTSDLHIFFQWLEKEYGKTNPADLAAGDLQAFINSLLAKENYKTNTVNRRVVSLSLFVNWAYVIGLLKQNFTEAVHCIYRSKNEMRFLTQEQQLLLLKSVEKELRLARLRFPKRWLSRQRDAALIKFLLHTGLRLNETRALVMSDLHIFDRKGAIVVRSDIQSRERVVPLNTDVRKAMLEWLAVRPEVDSDFIWIAIETKNPSAALSGRCIEWMIWRMGKEGGIEDLTPQMLRHTYARNLVDSGMDAENLARMLGFIGLKSARFYNPARPKDLEKAAEV